MPGLRVGHEVELRGGVVFGELHEVEAAASGERGDGVEGGRRVTAFSRVHVQVSGVPARGTLERSPRQPHALLDQGLHAARCFKGRTPVDVDRRRHVTISLVGLLFIA
jgi:hypothetical protein